MTSQEPQAINFLQENLILIGVASIIIFGYLVLLIRKRWKRGFRHDDVRKSDPPS